MDSRRATKLYATSRLQLDGMAWQARPGPIFQRWPIHSVSRSVGLVVPLCRLGKQISTLFNFLTPDRPSYRRLPKPRDSLHQTAERDAMAQNTKKIILSINAGSSSVKVSVYLAEKHLRPQQIAEAQLSGLTAPPAKLEYSRHGEPIVKDEEVSTEVVGQDEAFALLLDTLVKDGELREVGSKHDFSVACHRIVHGGDYTESRVINRDTYRHLEELGDLAPLHNGAALEIVESCMKQLPGATNVACFDSQFHATIPAHISTYPINPAVAGKNRLRKYGFHGLSYAFMARSVAEFLDRDLNQLNMIALHLGSGASACAVKGGRSWDTSMGLTPLEGLPGATRSGSVDPR